MSAATDTMLTALHGQIQIRQAESMLPLRIWMHPLDVLKVKRRYADGDKIDPFALDDLSLWGIRVSGDDAVVRGKPVVKEEK